MPETERKELRLITKIQKYYCHDIENRIPHGTGIKKSCGCTGSAGKAMSRCTEYTELITNNSTKI